MMAESVRKPMEHTSGHCQNCGHPLWWKPTTRSKRLSVDVKDNYNNTRMIEICKCCRCKNCTNK